MLERPKRILKILRNTLIFGSTGFFFYYNIGQTCKSINKIVNPKVLDREKQQPEYIYIDDPLYNLTLKLEHDKEVKQTLGISRIWKSLKYSLAWKLLWLCRHGNKDQRNIALEQLAAFKNNKIWDCCKLAQALDKNTAVLLARTRGADLRYFLPPPIHVRRAALSSELMSYKFRDLIMSVQNVNPHHCIQHFIYKHFINVQEQVLEVVEADSIPSKPDNISEKELCILCLDALHHHLTLFHVADYKKDLSTANLVNMGLLPKLAEAMLRFKNDPDFDLAVLKVLNILSIHTNLLTDFFQNGLLRELSRLLRSEDVRMSSSAAVCLANLSGEYHYRPGLYLLHPIYRTTKPPSCDTLLIHGLRGGVFVTWRQRDKTCAEPLGIMEFTMSDVEYVESSYEGDVETGDRYLDPDVRQVMKDLVESESEQLLSDYDVVLHDIPITALRDPESTKTYVAQRKRLALIQEDQDKSSYTFCWPKDWLPKDCNNLRILGVNYWSSLSEWLEICPLLSVDIPTRASEMVLALLEAGVGTKNTNVVWLAHSMGGLIVKEALVRCARSEDINLKQLSENTKAVLFFGTPHRGSGLATMPRAAAAVIWPSTDVKQLQVNSPMLLELHKEFIEAADLFKWETISFAETMPTLITAFKVPIRFVESNSADLGRGVFYQLPLDHLSLCKPATRQSVVYTTVLDVLQRVSLHGVDVPQNFIYFYLGSFSSFLRNKIGKILEIIADSKKFINYRWLKRIIKEQSNHKD